MAIQEQVMQRRASLAESLLDLDIKELSKVVKEFSSPELPEVVKEFSSPSRELVVAADMRLWAMRFLYPVTSD